MGNRKEIREIFGEKVEQIKYSGYLNAKQIFKAGNRWRKKNNLSEIKIKNWIAKNNSFIDKIDQYIGDPVITKNGIWVNPYIAIDMIMAFGKNIKLADYRWLYENTDSYGGQYDHNSYKKMCGAIYLMYPYDTENIEYVDRCIMHECGVSNWDNASNRQLAYRGRICEYIAELSDIVRNLNVILDIAFYKAKF